MNTEVGVLNKINAAGIIGIRNSQDTNKLLASILDHQMVEAKARRDAQAQSINNDIALRQTAPMSMTSTFRCDLGSDYVSFAVTESDPMGTPTATSFGLLRPSPTC